MDFERSSVFQPMVTKWASNWLLRPAADCSDTVVYVQMAESQFPAIFLSASYCFVYPNNGMNCFLSFISPLSLYYVCAYSAVG